MPRAKRTPKEIEAVKAEMLVQASALIAEQGSRGFSMRKLAQRLNIAAKTLYNDLHSKDEIYLEILTMGFERLDAACRTAQSNEKEPFDQLEAMCRAYTDFGLQEPNLYNLMFTWHVPIYNETVGTEMGPTARVELEKGLGEVKLFINAIQACTTGEGSLSEDEARQLMVQLWSQAHGYVAGINNTILNYMHDNPLDLRECLKIALMAHFRLSFLTIQSR
jgi:AcrR family transcriptional regulator